MEHTIMKFTKGDDANRLYALVRKLEDMGLVRIVGQDYDIVATANFRLGTTTIGPTAHENNARLDWTKTNKTLYQAVKPCADDEEDMDVFFQSPSAAQVQSYINRVSNADCKKEFSIRKVVVTTTNLTENELAEELK